MTSSDVTTPAAATDDPRVSETTKVWFHWVDADGVLVTQSATLRFADAAEVGAGILARNVRARGAA